MQAWEYEIEENFGVAANKNETGNRNAQSSTKKTEQSRQTSDNNKKIDRIDLNDMEGKSENKTKRIKIYSILYTCTYTSVCMNIYIWLINIYK